MPRWRALQATQADGQEAAGPAPVADGDAAGDPGPQSGIGDPEVVGLERPGRTGRLAPRGRPWVLKAFLVPLTMVGGAGEPAELVRLGCIAVIVIGIVGLRMAG